MSSLGFKSWTRDDRAEHFDLAQRGDLLELQNRYGGSSDITILNEVLGHAVDLGCRSVIAEYRYLDADYRNEHSRFYSTTFRRYPSIAHRLHFFRGLLPDDILDELLPTRFDQHRYLGYSVMRPISAGPVGRTVIAPLDVMAPHVSCQVNDTVNLFGSNLEVRGSPFMSQETQLGVCVHVTAWVCAYCHHLTFHAPRYLPGEIAALAPFEGKRLVPANAMSVGQLAEMLRGAGLPPIVYDLRNSRSLDEGLFTIACRYLNSGFPVIVAGGGHAFVLVGYKRTRDPSLGDHGRIQFIRQDDQSGPYQTVFDPYLDKWRPWEYLVIPLPQKVYISGETAERVGRDRLVSALDQAAGSGYRDLHDRIAAQEVVFRSTALPSNTFKNELIQRQVPDDLAASYQWTPMSRWIWVVEAVDRAAWNAGEPSVEAEVIIDATDHTGDPQPIAWRLPDQIIIPDPDDQRAVGRRPLGRVARLPTVCRVDARITE